MKVPRYAWVDVSRIVEEQSAVVVVLVMVILHQATVVAVYTSREYLSETAGSLQHLLEQEASSHERASVATEDRWSLV